MSIRLIPACTAVLTAAAVVASPAVAADTRMTPELIWKLGRVGNPQVSPDGKSLLFEVTRYDLEKNSGNTDVWLMSLADGKTRQLTMSDKSDSNARWSPDGKSIGFVSGRGGTDQVWVIDPLGGEAHAITDVKEGVANFAFAPDGKHVSFTSEVRIDKTLKDLYPDLPKANARIIDDLMYRHWDHWCDGTYSHLFVQKIANGAADGAPVDLMAGQRVDTPLTPDGDDKHIAWAPDGKEICYCAKIVDHPERSTDSDLYVVSVDGGAATNLTEGMDGYERDPSYSPDGRYIAFHSMQRAGFEADKNRLMVFDRTDRSIKELTAKFDQWSESFVWAPDSKSIVTSVPFAGTMQLFRVTLDGGVTPITEGRHNVDSPTFTPDGASIFALECRMERPPEVVKLAANGGAIETVTHVNDAIYAGLELPNVTQRVVKAKDGANLFCWVITPPGFDPGKKYPMLTYCQGGPQSPITQAFSNRWNFHLMAANGYVVVVPCRRGMPGFGQEWNDAISRHWGGLAMQDYLSATDDMFKEPWVDRAHTAAVGASFGGYSVYWLMGHDQENRFCAMVAHAGIFNAESWYGMTEELWFADWDTGGPYWSSPELQKEYDGFSPHRFAQNWDTPLLVIHGEKDFRVPVAEGIQAFTVAKTKGIPARFLYFPEAGHWVSKPQDSVLWQRVFFDWLDRWCKPAEH